MELHFTPDETEAAGILMTALTVAYLDDQDGVEEATQVLFSHPDRDQMLAVVFGSYLALLEALCDLTNEHPADFIQRLGLEIAKAFVDTHE